jgi:hypothetical protein
MRCEVMKRWIIFIVLLFPAAVVYANPTSFPLDVNLKLVVILGATFAAEAGLVAVILFFCHMAIVPTFGAMFASNLLMYFIIFRPVLEVTNNVTIVEAVIVAAEAVFIRIVSKVESFQEDEFEGLKWRTVFLVALVGNALSYYVGTIIAW